MHVIEDITGVSFEKVKILNVNIAAVNMEWLLDFVAQHIHALAGQYICFSNVHTTVTSYEDPAYCAIQNGAIIAAPDGGPLSTVGRKRGFKNMRRVAGPSFLEEILTVSAEKGYRHYFYGSTQETLDSMRETLQEKHPGVQVVGMYSPPFRALTPEEDAQVVRDINETNPHFVWVGLGAPKQEVWMAKHKGEINALMLGVGAGFDFLAGNLHRAPSWMQNSDLEWLYRLFQDPRRLFSRYLATNTKFVWNAFIKGR